MSIEKRQHVHGMWAAVAPRWEEHADYVETRAGALNAALLEGAALRRTDRARLQRRDAAGVARALRVPVRPRVDGRCTHRRIGLSATE